MQNILDYLAIYGSISLAEIPFNEVDAVFLARLSFVPFDRFVSASFAERRRLEDVCTEIAALPGLEDSTVFKRDIALLGGVIGKPRLGDLEISAFVNKIEEEDETQFAALCYHLPNDEIYLVYRGTDDSLIGWKENLNMVFVFPVPAQNSARRYFEAACEAYPDKKFILGGHSKGGNLAIYAGAFCAPRYRPQIKQIFNFDGPGFRRESIATEGYRAIAPRLTTYVPQSSVVGMILEQEGEYTIVHSGSIGLWQHGVQSWEVDGLQLKKVEEISASSRLFDHTLRSWLDELSLKQREAFVDCLYEVLTDNGAETLVDLQNNWFETFRGIIRAIRKMDEKDRSFVRRTFRLFFKSARSEAVRLLQEAGKEEN